MLLQFQSTLYNFTPKAVHRQVEIRIIKFNRINQFSYTDICIQFFFDFSDKCLSRCFFILNLTARKFPSILELPISSLRGNFSILFLLVILTFFTINHSQYNHRYHFLPARLIDSLSQRHCPLFFPYKSVSGFPRQKFLPENRTLLPHYHPYFF